MNIPLKEISVRGGALVGLRVKKEDESMRRHRALRRIDRELEKRNFKAALSLVKQLQGKPGGLLGFGSAKLIPKRMPKVDALELHGADNMSVGLLVDSIQRSIKCCLQFALEEQEGAQRIIGSLADSDAGPVLAQESLASSDYYSSLSHDRVMCLKHEAGHFLVGYLLGVLPKRYRIPTMEDLMRNNYAGGKVEFLGFEFLREVGTSSLPYISSAKPKQNNKTNTSSISSQTLYRFLCVILGGLVAEHLVFGYSELLHSDVEKLDRVLRWSGYKEDETDFQVKWAAMNTVLLLTEHHEAISRLAEAMALGKSIGSCIDAIESTLNHSKARYSRTAER